ncbi:MGMT family protein [Nocardioides sp. ChNu-153]|uniref:MGMT family protein n=1 Tax=unclassified Nocardioides TaxID=2615069 RepID=UPI002405134C|nr:MULTISPECIES: MGMT family protein [unclassified Nocardioides]MDF9717427.1 MGMT family protein [Nocardioides sp. ChNu-99]MDN7120867.1 MGMT family protein [Nocardioides sp. ChNu-153]
MSTDERFAEAVLRVVEAVPPGRVTTYGAIADVVGSGPRRVGSVLARDGGGVPWWRVVRADGSHPPQIRDRSAVEHAAEGTPRRPSGRVDVAAAFWQPDPGPPRVGPDADHGEGD